MYRQQMSFIFEYIRNSAIPMFKSYSDLSSVWSLRFQDQAGKMVIKIALFLISSVSEWWG